MENSLISTKDITRNKVKSLLAETNDYYNRLENLTIYHNKYWKKMEDGCKKFKEGINQKDRSEQSKNKLRNIVKKIEEASFLFRVYLPFVEIIGYIETYRNSNDIIDQLVSLYSVDDGISVEEIYYVLRELPKKVFCTIINNIQCSVYTHELLCQAIIDDNKEAFKNYIFFEALDITEVSKICSIYSRVHLIKTIMVDDSFDEEGDILIEELVTGINYNSSFLEKNFPAFSKHYTLIQQGDFNYELSIVAFKEMLQLYLERKIYYTSREQAIIEKVIKHPEYIDIYNDVINELNQEAHVNETNVPINAVSANHMFVLPDDYFKLPSNKDDDNSYIKNKRNFKAHNRGVKTFAEFVNYIAEQGYIDSTRTTLERFAFHLTSIRYPEDLELEEKVTWKGDIKALFYIVKYLCTVSSKYESLKYFFISDHEDFEKASAGSQYAERVKDEEFERKMYELYPDFFPRCEDEK